MNNNEYLALLSKGIKIWNKQRPRDSNLIKLAQLNLREKNLREIDLTLTDLSGTDLSGANLSGADFSGSELTNTKLINTNLSGANLTRAKFRNCIIENSDLSEAKLDGAQFENVSFTRTKLDNAIFSNANLRQIQFGTGENKNSLKGASFTSATFIDANLSDIDLTGINLKSADLNEANLSLTDLRGVDLSGAKLKKTILICANLRGANLSDTSLAYADMSGSDIGDAKFLGADLTGATLKGITLSDSDINNFRNANLNQIIVDDDPVIAQLIESHSANKTNQFSLSTYTIQIKQIKGGKNSTYSPHPIPLSKFYNGTDLFDFFHESLLKMNSLLTLNQKPKQDSSERIVLIVPSDTLKISARKITGTLGSGKYGIIRTIMNVNGGEITHIQTENEAGVQPYFFLIKIPKGKSEGIIILQNIGNHGIKSLFTDFISKQFKERYVDYRIDVKPFIPDEKIREVVSDGKVKKIIFIKNDASISTNSTEILDQNRKSINGKIELVVSADDIPLNHNFVENVNDFHSGNGIVDILFDSESFGFEYDTIKLEIDLGGKSRTIDLDKKSLRKSDEDITDKVEVDKYGNPIFISIENLASEICKDTEETLNKIY
ncbi:MAG: pentapeptide repeat-containing protein [Scytonema hyalinum WJT4-NPBG1]|jgi:uncharacterized protein YjbI with pentapeptide repeats|nr:pentapeptide repeat-containing protein [Scytonema hyalinum WJT4-NPBG1]